MDEWMLTHLRLAERQGLLIRTHLSEVQFTASKVLMDLEDLKELRSEAAAFKLAAATRDEFDIEKMFPQYFPDKVVESEEEAGGDAAYDYESVEWQSPSDADQETLNKMLSLLQQANGQVEGLGTPGSGKWV